MDKKQFKHYMIDAINDDIVEPYVILHMSNDMLEEYYKTNKRYYNILYKLITAYENYNEMEYEVMDFTNELLKIDKDLEREDGFQVEIHEDPANSKVDCILNGVSIFDYEDFIDEVQKL